MIRKEIKEVYKKISVIGISILIKLIIFHLYIGMKDQFWMITLKNFFLILALYSLLFLVKEDRRKRSFFIVHFLFSLLLFIDAVYYSNFFTLVPVHSLYQIGQIGTVSDSVWYYLRPKYLLFFVDFIVIFLYERWNHRDQEFQMLNITKKWKKTVALISLSFIIGIMGISQQIVAESHGLYTPYNLGVLSYHMYDVAQFVTKPEIQPQKIEKVIEDIPKVQEQVKGFGMAANRNVIVIQAESLQGFVLNKTVAGQEITPFLNRLLQEDTIYFSRYYEQVGWGNTSDAEFISQNGFYPSSGLYSYKEYEKNHFQALPMLLKEQGYKTLVFHGNEPDFWNRKTIYPKQGWDHFISLDELEADERIGVGLSDRSLFRQAIPILKDQNSPFYSFFVTLTSHHPFMLDEKYCDLKLPKEYEGTILGGYLQSVHYFDQALEKFVEDLKSNNLYEDTVIILYGDHKAFRMEDEEQEELLTHFLGKPYEEDEMYRIPLMVHIPGKPIQEEITRVGGQVDFFPTVANLVGISIPLDSIVGKDLLQAEKGFAVLQPHTGRGSFIDDEKIFILGRDGRFENSKAWNLKTGVPVSLEECREGYEQAIAEVTTSEYILKHDLIPRVWKEGLKKVFTNKKVHTEIQ